MWRLGVTALILSASFLGSAPAASAQVIDLGTYPGGSLSEVFDINEHGVAVGFADLPDGTLRFMMVDLRGPHGPEWTDLGNLGGDFIGWNVTCWQCGGVSNSGLVAGTAAIPGGYGHAFAWTTQSGMVDLGTLGGPTAQSWAEKVNKNGSLIVGASYGGPSDQDLLPVVWLRDERAGKWKIHELETAGVENAANCNPWSVNNSGLIAGGCDVNGAGAAVLWYPVPGKQEWRAIRLPGNAEYPETSLRDINESGEIVGAVFQAGFSAVRPALWKLTRTGWVLTVLPTLSSSPPAYSWNVALGITDAGDIVGTDTTSEGEYVAVRWTKGNPHTVQRLGLPGCWSEVLKVNSNRIAVGAYGCEYERAVAVRFR